MEWMLMPLRRYAEFSGRSRRKEYWMFVLLNVILSAFSLFVLSATFISGMSETAMMTIMTPIFALHGLAALAFFIPGLAVTIRRLHDTDRSGWNLLWGAVPLIGGFMLLYFYISEGTQGPNRFGPDPKMAG